MAIPTNRHGQTQCGCSYHEWLITTLAVVARGSSSEVLKFWACMRCAPLCRPRQRPFSKPLQVATREFWLQVVLESEDKTWVDNLKVNGEQLDWSVNTIICNNLELTKSFFRVGSVDLEEV